MFWSEGKKKQPVDPDHVTPEYIFDQGYCTWLETYPGEKSDIKEEKDKILKLQETDRQQYLKEIMAWNINRLKTLKAELETALSNEKVMEARLEAAKATLLQPDKEAELQAEVGTDS